MNKKEIVFKEVSELYQNSDVPLSKWMWNNHVQWVADRAMALAVKYGADVDKVYCAALLHDLGDCKYLRGHEDFSAYSELKGKEILNQASFSEEDTQEIIEVIIRPHSCRPGNLPQTLEGKVLATADAMFHLQTSFFPLFCFKKRPKNAETYEDWQAWFLEKIERDYGPKIFFEDERLAVKDDYTALLRVFGNKTLNSSEN